jgi:hypothetical protein
MAKADELLRANVTLTGAAQDDRYCPARDHIRFCDETAIYRGDLRAWQLPERRHGGHPVPAWPTWACAQYLDGAAR